MTTSHALNNKTTTKSHCQEDRAALNTV